MTSQNNPLRSQRGSALIVTMLLVSVLLATALILLQRIVPYAKSVRSMHDASQAYYEARGQVDLARHNFLYTGGSGSFSMNIHFGPAAFFQFLSNTGSPSSIERQKKRKALSEGRSGGGGTPTTAETELTVEDVIEEIPLLNSRKEIRLALPFITISGNVIQIDPNKKKAYAVSPGSSENPLKIKLFPQDSSTKNFGTSKKDSTSHTLSSRNAGGLRFDLRGVNTTSIPDSNLKLKFPSGILSPITLILKMQYFAGSNTSVETFTQEYTVFPSSPGTVLPLNTTTLIGNIQEIKTDGTITSSSGTFQSFLTQNDCSTATLCSLSLILKSSPSTSIDFQLISSTPLPDLNAVVVGDGLSGNQTYHQRIIDLIPTPQDI